MRRGDKGGVTGVRGSGKSKSNKRDSRCKIHEDGGYLVPH